MDSTKTKLPAIGCNSIRNINTIYICLRYTWLAFSPLSKNNCKIRRIFSLLVPIFNARSNRIESSNHKTFCKVFPGRNLIFLMPYKGTLSHLYNATHRNIYAYIMDYFFLDLIFMKMYPSERII